MWKRVTVTVAYSGTINWRSLPLITEKLAEKVCGQSLQQAYGLASFSSLFDVWVAHDNIKSSWWSYWKAIENLQRERCADPRGAVLLSEDFLSNEQTMIELSPEGLTCHRRRESCFCPHQTSSQSEPSQADSQSGRPLYEAPPSHLAPRSPPQHSSFPSAAAPLARIPAD